MELAKYIAFGWFLDVCVVEVTARWAQQILGLMPVNRREKNTYYDTVFNLIGDNYTQFTVNKLKSATRRLLTDLTGFGLTSSIKNLITVKEPR